MAREVALGDGGGGVCRWGRRRSRTTAASGVGDGRRRWWGSEVVLASGGDDARGRRRPAGRWWAAADGSMGRGEVRVRERENIYYLDPPIDVGPTLPSKNRLHVSENRRWEGAKGEK